MRIVRLIGVVVLWLLQILMAVAFMAIGIAKFADPVMVNVERVRELQPTFHGEFVVSLHTGQRLRCSRTYADRLTKAMGS